HPKGYLDISTNRGGEWTVHDHRSLPVGGSWHTLRIDVTGKNLDVYFDGLYVRSLEFPDPASVRGGFGLICGPGKARYRNIRLLERDLFDPATRIERELAMAKVMGDASQRTEGSFAGFAPPDFGELEWRQGDPVTLGELRGSPVMLVFWGPVAEAAIPCAAYFEHLQRRSAQRGLRMLVICDPGTTPEALDSFLGKQSMEGMSIAIDQLGATYEAFYVKPGFFGMPRVLLVGKDGLVSFEGDPGLKVGRGWQPGDAPTYVDAALEELLAK
ncbi:MAG: hypothetical protein VYE77_00070, partial [Planctomycetota bacterium]|nr:hypothetical protein [Planctomycetota bacterium]